MSKTLRFLLWGCYGVRNFGDEVMKDTIIQELRDRFRDCTIFIRCEGDGFDRIENQTNYFYFKDGLLHTLCRIKTILAHLNRIDVLIIGGGTIFLSQKKRRISRLLNWLLLILVGRILHKKVVLFSVGIGEVNTKLESYIMRLIINSCNATLARESSSYSKFVGVGPKKSRVILTGDVVALYDTYEGANYSRTGKKCFGVSLMPYFSTYIKDSEKDLNFVTNMAKYLDWLVNKYGCDLKFFCMKDSSNVKDQEISEKVIRAMSNGNACSVVPYSTDYVKTISLMQNVDFFIGMRLHAIFYPLRCGIPTLGLLVNQKILNIMLEYKVPEFCVGVEEIGGDLIKKMTVQALDRGKETSRGMNTFASISQNAEVNFKVLESVISNKNPIHGYS